MTWDRWVLVDRRPTTDNPGTLESRQNPLAPRSPLLFPKPRDPPRTHVSGTLPATEGGSGGFNEQRVTTEKGHTPGRQERAGATEGRPEAQRARRGAGRHAGKQSVQGSRVHHAAQPETLQRLHAGRSRRAWGERGVVTGPRDEGAWGGGAVLGPTELSNRTSRDLAGRSGRRDTPEATLRDAGRASARPSRQGLGCPGCRHERKTGEGKARSCLPV